LISMGTRRFFSDNPVNGSVIRITGDEYHHLKHVNRARCGDQIEVIDGRGSFFVGEIRELKPAEAVVHIKSSEKQDKPVPGVILAPSLLKQRPMNLMIEKLTEIGVDEIRPVMFRRTDETYSPSRLKKWRRTAIQSLKVNKRPWLTDIFPPVNIDEIIALSQSFKTRILLDITAEKPLPASWSSPVIAVVGPPGGMEEEEREQFIRQGFLPCQINDSVLKTETAAISIGAILKSFCGGSRGAVFSKRAPLAAGGINEHD
jgi:16S rRNA (uracil1498-N3)-methyltransferase